MTLSRPAILNRRSMIFSGFAALAAIHLPEIAEAASVSRRLRMFNAHTGETFDRTYFKGDRYVKNAMEEFFYFARDWRQNQETKMDPRVMDISWAVQQQLRSPKPLVLFSGYRTKKTNGSLKGTAPHSFHMVGRAMDISHDDRTTRQLYDAARVVNGGGIGKYSDSHFVHVDSGPLRTWGA